MRTDEFFSLSPRKWPKTTKNPSLFFLRKLVFCCIDPSYQTCVVSPFRLFLTTHMSPRLVDTKSVLDMSTWRYQRTFGSPSARPSCKTRVGPFGRKDRSHKSNKNKSLSTGKSQETPCFVRKLGWGSKCYSQTYFGVGLLCMNHRLRLRGFKMMFFLNNLLFLGDVWSNEARHEPPKAWAFWSFTNCVPNHHRVEEMLTDSANG